MAEPEAEAVWEWEGFGGEREFDLEWSPSCCWVDKTSVEVMEGFWTCGVAVVVVVIVVVAVEVLVSLVELTVDFESIDVRDVIGVVKEITGERLSSFWLIVKRLDVFYLSH